ncbi:MAG: YSC84-related protein [Chthoniobacterales bacterium]
MGSNGEVVAGSVVRDLNAGVIPTAAVYTYSRSRGLCAVVSLEGAIIRTQKTATPRYHGRTVNARSILSGRVSLQSGAQHFLSVLRSY